MGKQKEKGKCCTPVGPKVNLFGVWGGETTPSSGSFILMENDEYILQEDNVSKIELE